MFPSCGTMCKHVLLLIGFCMFVKCQTVDHQRTTRLQSIRHEIFGNIEDSENTFPNQNSTTTNSPFAYADSTTEAELSSTTENSDGVETSTTTQLPSTTLLHTEPTIKPELLIKNDPNFGDLDDESLQLYSKLSQIFNESQKLSSELDLGESKGVLLIGNSGSGKTTLVQLLAGNISTLEAKELSQDSGDYYIDDGHKINNGMGFSSSFSVDLVRDNETGVVFADYPGFRESIGAAKDLEIAMNMKVVAESFQRSRIALVCPHSFLKKGTYRAAFTNFLERVADFLKNSEHHISGITLIVTKVKSSYFYKKGQFQLVSDKAELKAIANFINEVKVAYSNQHSSEQRWSDDSDRFTLIHRILINLLAKRSGEYRRIKIFRIPDDSGPLINQSLIMREREEIRELLLEEEGFETVQKDSFGSSILAKTKEELDTLYRKLDSYITNCAEEFGSYLRNEFIGRIRNDSDENSDIGSVISKRKYDLDMIQSIRKQIGKCRSPEDFVKVVKAYIESRNLTYDGTKMDYIEARNDLLNKYSSISTKHKSTNSYLSPANWQNGLKGAEKAIENEYLYQSMLQETFLRLREYRIEKRKLPLGDDPEASDPESLIDPKNVIIELNLPTYACLEFNKDEVEEFNEIVVRTFTRDQKNIRCDKNMLIIIDKFVFVSDVQEQLSRCSYIDSIVLLAADTIIIDSDLDAELLEGRNLMILAPQWLVPGKRSLMVSGKPHEEKQPKAGLGEVGLDGKDGNPSGSFLGIGLRFQGIEDLTVQACGGDGQNGQDGGDGRDGTDGVDNAFTVVKNEKEVHVPLIYNVETSVKKKEGTLGSAGQDSGAGGKGGKGGAKGSINIIDLVHQNSSTFQGLGYSSLECEGRQGLPGADGKPGESGSNGCSTVETTRAHEIFGRTFDVFSNTDTHNLPCNRTTPKGEVLRETRINLYVPRQRDSLPPACKMFDRLMMFIDDSRYYSSKLTVKSIEAFRNNVKEKLCF